MSDSKYFSGAKKGELILQVASIHTCLNTHPRSDTGHRHAKTYRVTESSSDRRLKSSLTYACGCIRCAAGTVECTLTSHIRSHLIIALYVPHVASAGELFELKQQLNSSKKGDKRDAVKKVIASMTVGKDVSSLFSDVINCMQTDNLELKKLVYLYLMNYAKSQPDLAILAVNTFVKVRFAVFILTATPETNFPRTAMTRIRLFALWQSAPWAASASTKSPSTSASRCATASRTPIPTSARPLPSASPSFTILNLR